AAPNLPPSTALDASTSGLTVSMVSEQPNVPGRMISGVDATLGARVDGESGASELTLKLRDAHGPLVSATTTFTADVARAVREPAQLWSRLQTTPLHGKITLEDRSLDELPSFVAESEVTGKLRADATLSGTLRDPLLSAKAELRELRFGESERALDVCGAVD